VTIVATLGQTQSLSLSKKRKSSVSVLLPGYLSSLRQLRNRTHENSPKPARWPLLSPAYWLRVAVGIASQGCTLPELQVRRPRQAETRRLTAPRGQGQSKGDNTENSRSLNPKRSRSLQILARKWQRGKGIQTVQYWNTRTKGKESSQQSRIRRTK
jgi:hypothetical protein